MKKMNAMVYGALLLCSGNVVAEKCDPTESFPESGKAWHNDKDWKKAYRDLHKITDDLRNNTLKKIPRDLPDHVQALLEKTIKQKNKATGNDAPYSQQKALKDLGDICSKMRNYLNAGHAFDFEDLKKDLWQRRCRAKNQVIGGKQQRYAVDLVEEAMFIFSTLVFDREDVAESAVRSEDYRKMRAKQQQFVEEYLSTSSK